jgi:hypothetical protein
MSDKKPQAGIKTPGASVPYHNDPYAAHHEVHRTYPRGIAGDPERERLYDMNVQFGDMEFMTDVLDRMGPAFTQGARGGKIGAHALLDPVMEKYGERWTLNGMVIKPDGYWDKNQTEYQDRYDKVFYRTGHDVAPGVYALGGENQTSDLYGHEFRHAADHDRFALSEQKVRLWDAWTARDPSEWREAVLTWQDYLWKTVDDGLPEPRPYDEAEQELLGRLDQMRGYFLDTEVGHSKELGLATPNDRSPREYYSDMADYRRRRIQSERWDGE